MLTPLALGSTRPLPVGAVPLALDADVRHVTAAQGALKVGEACLRGTA